MKLLGLALLVIGLNLQVSNVSMRFHKLLFDRDTPHAHLVDLQALLNSWRYWPNIGCYEFSFERTVFFELTNGADQLPCDGCQGSELRK